MSTNTFANLIASSGVGAGSQLNGGRATEYEPDHAELLAQCHFIVAGLEPAAGFAPCGTEAVTENALRPITRIHYRNALAPDGSKLVSGAGWGAITCGGT